MMVVASLISFLIGVFVCAEALIAAPNMAWELGLCVIGALAAFIIGVLAAEPA